MADREALPEDVRQALKTGRGLLDSAKFGELGISHDRVERLVRRGSLVMLAKGIYADGKSTVELEPWDRFALRTRAFVLSSPGGTAAADWSAIAVHRLPAVGMPPPVPSVIRAASSTSGSNRTCHGRTRLAAVAPSWLTDVDQTPVMHAAFAAVDLSRRCDPLAALTLTDSVAGRDGSNARLLGAWDELRAWPGIKRARWFVDNCDPDSQTPLETAGRLALLRAGLPIPASNAWVGEFSPKFRLDHYWPEQRLAMEGDGIGKYLLGADPAASLRKEKEREIWLAFKGIRVIRYTWKLAVGSPQDLAEHCRQMLNQAPMPAAGELRCWPSRVGAELLGLRR